MILQNSCHLWHFLAASLSYRNNHSLQEVEQFAVHHVVCCIFILFTKHTLSLNNHYGLHHVDGRLLMQFSGPCLDKAAAYQGQHVFMCAQLLKRYMFIKIPWILGKMKPQFLSPLQMGLQRHSSKNKFIVEIKNDTFFTYFLFYAMLSPWQPPHMRFIATIHSYTH